MASQVVEGAMVEWSSYVRGHHVYLELWTPPVGEVLSLKDNNHDNYCVAVMKGYTVVVHVPRPASNVCFHFLGRDGHRGFCEVTRSHLNQGVNVGLEIPCILVYSFYGSQRFNSFVLLLSLSCWSLAGSFITVIFSWGGACWPLGVKWSARLMQVQCHRACMAVVWDLNCWPLEGGGR